MEAMVELSPSDGEAWVELSELHASLGDSAMLEVLKRGELSLKAQGTSKIALARVMLARGQVETRVDKAEAITTFHSMIHVLNMVDGTSVSSRERLLASSWAALAKILSESGDGEDSSLVYQAWNSSFSYSRDVTHMHYAAQGLKEGRGVDGGLSQYSPCPLLPT